MTPIRPLSVLAQASLFLLASLALAALQNITVDDAVLTGAVVPRYLPSESAWSICSTCTECLARPDPSQAYGGTWHDTTFDPDNGLSQAIEFTFTGSALYIFFITANTIPDVTTFTNVDFVLDNVAVGRYTHAPSASTDYHYNVSVYVNESLAFGEHSMTIQPVDSGSDVLILFDYLIYSMDTPSSASPSVTATTTSPSLATSSRIQGSFSGQNIGAIVGGALGGVSALVLMTAFLLRYGQNTGCTSRAAERAMVEPFILSLEAAPTSRVGTTSSTYPMKSFSTKPAWAGESFVARQPLIPPPTTTAYPLSGASSTNTPALLEEVGLLRDEVARLRYLHGPDGNIVESRFEAPPEYS